MGRSHTHVARRRFVAAALASGLLLAGTIVPGDGDDRIGGVFAPQDVRLDANGEVRAGRTAVGESA